ncbi:coenzyme F420-0:L-glutamate ligase [Aeromicrobium marinum]|nr:coenzyme F420-0:L-glutamate ligase [Aeromicrobium marinum]
MSLTFTAVEGIGEIVPGDDLGRIIASAAPDLADGDVVVVTSKVVAKAAGLATSGSREDLLAEQTDRAVATRGDTRIVRTHHGLTLAAAGIDASNTSAGTLLPLPVDPDGDARAIRARLAELTGRRVAVVVSDTAGRAWRHGQTDIAIGCAGLEPLESFAGRTDPHGNRLVVTAPAVADEIAGAAELASGKLGGRPVVVVRGVPAHLLTAGDGPGATALVRAEDDDLFGLGARDAVVAAVAADGASVRGFTPTTITPAALVELAGVPVGIGVDVDGDLVRVAAPTDHLVAAGAVQQRLLTLATAHRVVVRVEVEHLT